MLLGPISHELLYASGMSVLVCFLAYIHRVILDWKVPGDDRIQILLSEKNRILVGETGTGAWKQGL